MKRDTERITVAEICKDMGLGRRSVTHMLTNNMIPSMRVGRRWIIGRTAYENWKRTLGMPKPVSNVN